MRIIRKQGIFCTAECGQASLEFAAMLIGFGMLLLGLIFLCAVSFDDNGILLDAKYRAESAAQAAGEQTSSAGSEIQTWSYAKLRYSTVDGGAEEENSVSIPFTATDRVVSTDNNSISGAGNDFSDASVSEPTPRSGGGRTFTYDYKWLSPGGFASDFCGDYTDELNGGNAMNAAGLLKENGSGNTCGTMEKIFRNAKGNGSAVSSGQIYNWFGLRVRESDLNRSPSNQVYMPRNR